MRTSHTIDLPLWRRLLVPAFTLCFVLTGLAGEFPDAIQTAQKALQLVQSNGALADALEREVKLYEAGRALPAAQR